MFGIYFADKAPTEYRDWANSDHDLYDAIALGMLVRGAMPEPDLREPWFLCEAHADGNYADRIISIFERLARRGARRPCQAHAANRTLGDVARARLDTEG